MTERNLWNQFIECTASEDFETKRALRDLFIIRFKDNNHKISVREIAELSEPNNDNPRIRESNEDKVRANLSNIYKHFRNKYNSFREQYENSNLQRKSKSCLLRKWLFKNLYPSWKDNYLQEKYPTPSGIYIEREPTVDELCEEVLDGEALIRLKAPLKMGKTLLLNRASVKLLRQEYQIIEYNFDSDSSEVFTDYRTFIKSFLSNITRKLSLDDECLNSYTETDGINKQVINYFKEYLLAKRNCPLVLILKLDRVFEHSAIAKDFCALLRGLYSKSGENPTERKVFQNLRLIVIHSTDIYGTFNLHNSPLSGVGKVFVLNEFTGSQIREYVERCQLSNLTDVQIEELIDLIGGHPYLLKQACEYINRHSWDEFKTIATDYHTPFDEHLRGYLLQVLDKNIQLKEKFLKVINSSKPVFLPPNYLHKLKGMGLVKIEGDYAIVRCKLYSQYFAKHLN